MKRFLTLGPTISFSHLVLSWIQSLEPQFYSQLAYRPHSEFFIMNFTFWIIWAARVVVEHFFNFLKVFSFWDIVKVSVCEFKRKSSSINQLQIKLGLHFLRRAIRQLGNIRWWPSIMWEFWLSSPGLPSVPSNVVWNISIGFPSGKWSWDLLTKL